MFRLFRVSGRVERRALRKREREKKREKERKASVVVVVFSSAPFFVFFCAKERSSIHKKNVFSLSLLLQKRTERDEEEIFHPARMEPSPCVPLAPSLGGGRGGASLLGVAALSSNASSSSSLVVAVTAAGNGGGVSIVDAKRKVRPRDFDFFV